MPTPLTSFLLPSRPQLAWTGGVLLAMGVGAVLYLMTAQSVEHDARDRFQQQARNVQYSIASRINAYTDVLRGAASFFQASDSVNRASFHRYVQGLAMTEHFPALDNINYAEHVTDVGRDAFERAARDSGEPHRDGHAGFAIYPPGRRAEYAVITLIEPLAPFRDRLGLDIAARPHVARVTALARDSGGLATSGLPIDIRRGAGLAMRLPVYRKDMPLGDVAQRRAAYLGSVGIGFSVPRLIEGALAQVPGHNVRLALYDGGTSGDPHAGQRLLFDNGRGGTAAQPRLVGRFVTELALDFNGRQWRAQFSANKDEWTSPFDHYLPWLALLAGFVATLLFYLLFHTLSSSRLRAIKMAKAMTKELRNSQARLQLSHHKLRRLAAHTDQIKELERKRIAREIHDDLGQNLLVLRIEADLLATRTRHRHPRLHARASATLAQIDSTIRSVRHIINDLRPAVLDLGLNAAVEWQIAQFRERSAMACELVEHQRDIRVDDHCATALFRVLQESLSNILQHARASMVRVELRQHGGKVCMTISDNGIGLPDTSRNKKGSFGLVGMEERISLLGGVCTVRGTPNAGTVVTVAVPLQRPAGLAHGDAGGQTPLA